MELAFDAAQDVSDEALLVAYGNGDASAARILMLRLTPKVLGFAARMLRGDRAEAEAAKGKRGHGRHGKRDGDSN